MNPIKLWLTDESYKKYMGVTPLTALHIIAWAIALFGMVMSGGNNILFMLPLPSLIIFNLIMLLIRVIRKVQKVISYTIYILEIRRKTRVVKTTVYRRSVSKKPNKLRNAFKSLGQLILRQLVRLASTVADN